MPIFIRNSAESVGAHDLDQAPVGAYPITRVRYNQAVWLHNRGITIYRVIDCSDRGGPRRRAKRWNRWFVSAAAIAALEGDLTPSLRRRVAACSR